MSAVPFRAGREGVFANVGDSTFLVRRTPQGFAAFVNGSQAGDPRPSQKAALADAQRLASAYAEGLLVASDTHLIVLAEPEDDDPVLVALHGKNEDEDVYAIFAESASGVFKALPWMTSSEARALAERYDVPITFDDEAELPDTKMSRPAHSNLGDTAEGTTTANDDPQEDPMTTTSNTTKDAEKAAVRKAASAKGAETRKRNAEAKKQAEQAEAEKAEARSARSANREAIIRMHGEDKKVSEIAEALGISSGRVRQILMDSGLVKVASRNPERDARIIAAIDAGEDPATVAEREGIKEFRARWIHKVAKAGAA